MTIKDALVFDHSGCAVFDETGQQIPELQVSWISLWAEHTKKLGYDPEGVIFETQWRRKLQIRKMDDGSYSMEVLQK